ncbi:MAG TPA: terminase small subunit [Terriglobales bacterium]|nr:terminase small subunit [Terriglobales bacterium]
MTKTDVLAIASPGSRALRNAKYERYCRLRASALPRISAYREAGWETSDDNNAYSNACRLERRSGVRERIEYLSHQEEGLIGEKRRWIEEQLWAIHEADIGDYFETIDIDGKTIERPKRLSDLPPEISKNIEKIAISANGRLVPQLYSKLAASQELRKMLNIGGQKDHPETDVSRLSDAELIQQLADQAKELGIEINLNYSFAQQSDE